MQRDCATRHLFQPSLKAIKDKTQESLAKFDS